MGSLREYYLLAKPGIVKGNALHVVAGALFASTMGIDGWLILAVLTGTSFVIASACVANNIIDRNIDAKMQRTKSRASVTGTIALRSALVYTVLLAVIGFGVLLSFTNGLVVLIGALAYVMYVAVYGYAKRRSSLSTLIGAIPGALPAMAGVVAVTGEVTIQAWLLFLLVFAWQMPHFYAISVFRKHEYAAAGIPVLSVVSSFEAVRRAILGYMLLYVAVIIAMIAYDAASAPVGLLLLVGSGYWLFTFLRTDTKDQSKWARTIFGASLLLTLLLLAASLLNVFIPPMSYGTM